MADETTTAPSLADQINNALTPISEVTNAIIFYSVDINGVALPLVVVWLLAAGVVLTFSLGFPNFRGFRHGWSLIFKPRKHEDSPGEISHFQALSSALSGTVGLGNIASVPIAIALGGPGAIFWMIFAGLFGMSSKFAECALAVKYRKVRPDGTILGGPMYYIEDAMARRGWKMAGKIGAIFFAITCMGASVSFFQVNQSHAQFETVTGHSIPLTYGIIMSVCIAVVILGGIKTIGKVTSVLVPAMGVIYMGAGLIIIMLNVDALPAALASIFKGAFGLEAAGGGMVGALINGMKRATYSSEAGVGSAAIAHAAVRTKDPMTEGYVALLEPFIDTVVVCSVTALVILVTGVYISDPGLEGIQMTSAAFAGTFSWYPYILLVSVVLFAFSTLVSWSYYGAQAANYLFGDTKRTDTVFKITLCALLSVGATIELSAIVDLIDAMLFGMAIPNIIALYLLLPELRADQKIYAAKVGIKA